MRVLAYILIAAVAVSFTPLTAQTAGTGASDIFISTSPIGAAVLLNGELLAGATPLLVRQVQAGRYELTLLKDGYPAIETSLEVSAGQPSRFFYPLPRHRFIPAPYETSLTLNGQPLVRGEKGISLPEGSYQFSWDDQTLDIVPVYPGKGAIRALDILVPSLFGLAGVLMGEELVWNQQEYFSVSPFSVGLATVGGVLGIIDLRLRSQQRDYLRRIDPVPVGKETATAEAELLFSDARDALGAGRTEEAAMLLEELIGSHQDSRLLPEALYTLGRVRLILGQFALAAVEFRLIIEEFPDPGVFDKACKALSDYYLLQGDFNSAIQALGSMVYIDPAFTREDISALESAYRAEANRGVAE